MTFLPARRPAALVALAVAALVALSVVLFAPTARAADLPVVGSEACLLVVKADATVKAAQGKVDADKSAVDDLTALLDPVLGATETQQAQLNELTKSLGIDTSNLNAAISTATGLLCAPAPADPTTTTPAPTSTTTAPVTDPDCGTLNSDQVIFLRLLVEQKATFAGRTAILFQPDGSRCSHLVTEGDVSGNVTSTTTKLPIATSGSAGTAGSTDPQVGTVPNTSAGVDTGGFDW